MRTILAALIGLTFITPALAYKEGHEGDPPEIRAWFQRQKQPDSDPVYPTSCCGDYDAFEADEFVTEGDQFIAIITNGKGTIPDGTRVVIPPNKMPHDNHDPNPSGHGIVFMSITGDGEGHTVPLIVYCYFPPAGL